jgi:hypothetical protein
MTTRAAIIWWKSQLTLQTGCNASAPSLLLFIFAAPLTLFQCVFEPISILSCGYTANSTVVCSYQFTRNRTADVATTPWDLVVIDETHRRRNRAQVVTDEHGFSIRVVVLWRRWRLRFTQWLMD